MEKTIQYFSEQEPEIIIGDYDESKYEALVKHRRKQMKPKEKILMGIGVGIFVITIIVALVLLRPYF